MPVLEWDAFSKRHPRPHLVSGVYTSEGTTERAPLILRLLVALGVKGDYSITTIRDRGLWFTQLGFESEIDAKKFAVAVLAKPKTHFTGFVSQQEFWLDDAMEKNLFRLLAVRDFDVFGI